MSKLGQQYLWSELSAAERIAPMKLYFEPEAQPPSNRAKRKFARATPGRPRPRRSRTTALHSA